MASRKQRTRVVFDTNVVARFYLGRNPQSANANVFRLWRDRRFLELVVSPDIVGEYVDVLERLAVNQRLIQRFVERLENRVTVTWISLGPRVVASRDPDDDAFLSAARAGHVTYLVTNDRDLLELPTDKRQKLRFEIVTPTAILAQVADQ